MFSTTRVGIPEEQSKLQFPLCVFACVFSSGAVTLLFHFRGVSDVYDVAFFLGLGLLTLGLRRLYLTKNEPQTLILQNNDQCTLHSELQRCQNLIENIPGAVYRCALDRDGTLEYISDGIQLISGYPARSFMQGQERSFVSLIHPDDIALVDQATLQAIASRQSYHIEYRIFHSGGSIRYVLERGRAVYHPKTGETLWLDGVILNVTERKLALAALEERTDFINKVMDLTPGLIHVFSIASERTIFCNPKVCSILGFSQQEFCSMGTAELHALIHPEDLEHIQTMSRRLAELKDGEVFDHEFRIKQKLGTWIWLRERVTVFRRNTAGQTMETLSLIEDMTQHKATILELEQQREHAHYTAKMASLGEMAGGIAHEINNPLAIILGRAHQIQILLRRQPTDSEHISECLLSLIQTCDRISKIIGGLRSFSRDGSHDPMCVISVRQILEDSISLCEAKFQQQSIALELVASEQDLQCRGRLVQLSQVVLNLLCNAGDAIEGSERPWVRVEAFESRDHCGIRVTDSGLGIEHMLHDKIMQPFFTTKPSGKGTGLGLSISRTIASAHGGELWLDKQSKHTSFVMSLPKVLPEGLADSHLQH